MALLTPEQLATMDYVYLGAPFVYVPAKAAILTQTMDYVYLGAPFVTSDYVSVAPTSARSFGFIFG
jgi:hypothetical protein